MKRIVVSGLCVLVVLLSAAIVFWPSPPPAAEIVSHAELTVDGEVRHYRLVLPHKLLTNRSLIIAFHGTGDSTEAMAAYSRLDHLAAESGFVLVYPGSLEESWDTRPSGDRENVDLKFAVALIEEIVSQYSIDRHRVYAIGMSNGGTFAQLLAANKPNRIAAVVSHSGVSPTQLPSQPVLLIAGNNDPGHDSIQKNARSYSANGVNTQFVSVRGLGHEWSPEHNGRIWEFVSGSTNDEQ